MYQLSGKKKVKYITKPCNMFWMAANSSSSVMMSVVRFLFSDIYVHMRVEKWVPQINQLYICNACPSCVFSLFS